MRFCIKALASAMFITLGLQSANGQGAVPVPGGTGPVPGGGLPRPGGGIPRPGGGIPTPGASLPTPGASLGRPGASLPRPGASLARPGASLPRPGGGLPSLGGNAVPLGGSVPQPGSGSPQAAPVPTPGTTTAQSQAQTNQTGQAQTNANAANPSTAGSVNQNGQNVWFLAPTVRSHLKINEAQANLLNQQYSQLAGASNMGQAQFNGSTSISDEQRISQSQATNRFYDDLSRSMKDVLSRDQHIRFNQLGLQYRGFKAFNDPVIAQRLQLTNDQLARLQSYEQNYDQQSANVYQLRATDPNAFPARFGQLRNEMSRQIDGLLTPEQRNVWKELTGDPHTFVAE